MINKYYHNTLQENVKELGIIFHPFLLCLVFFPGLIAAIIDFSIYDFRYLIIDLVWLALFSSPNLYFKNQKYFKGVSISFFLLGLIQVLHWVIIKGPLTVTSLLVLSNTNSHEALEFLELKASFDLIYVPLYIVFFIVGFKRINKNELKFNTSVLSVIIIVFALVFVLETVTHGRFARKGAPQVGKVAFSFIERLSLYKEAAKEVHPKQVDAVSLVSGQKQTTILVIGESLSRNHMSIYGYNRKTNPLLEKHDDLILYSDVVSPYSNTLESVLSICSKSTLDNVCTPEEEVDIFDIYHSAGYKTFWLSNQSPIGVWDNMITVMANQADVASYVNLNSNSSFEATYTASYDEKLFPQFNKALKDTAQKKLIVLHLMGSHSTYTKRFPSDYQNFSENETEKEELINNYDNTVLYNDYVLNKVLEMSKSECSSSLCNMILLSDHAENVFDEGEKCGHDYTGPLPKSNVEIPFIVWLSEHYKNKFPVKTTQIQDNNNLPFVTDDLFFSMIDLSKIKSSHLDSTRSIFSKKYNKDRQRVLEDGRDYDKN